MPDYIPRIVDNIEEPPLIRELKRQHKSEDIYLPAPETIPPEIFEAYPETEYLGNGASAIVIVDPADENKIISFQYRERERSVFYSELELLEKYHMHKVLHLLLPENFPKVFSTSKKTGQTKKERIHVDEELNRIKDSMNRSQYQRIYRELEAKASNILGFELILDDHSADNLLYDRDGNIKYVDFVDNNAVDFEVDIERALAYFDERKQADPDREKVALERRDLQRSITRLTELAIIDSYKRRRQYRQDLFNKLTPKQQQRVKYVLNKTEERMKKDKVEVRTIRDH